MLYVLFFVKINYFQHKNQYNAKKVKMNCRKLVILFMLFNEGCVMSQSLKMAALHCFLFSTIQLSYFSFDLIGFAAYGMIKGLAFQMQFCFQRCCPIKFL